MTQTIACKYTCDNCGIKNQIVQVQSRGEEDIIDWMDKIFGPAIGKDHMNRSPNCRVLTLTNAMIPINDKDENAKIGGPL